jgi:hypothetical protein
MKKKKVKKLSSYHAKNIILHNCILMTESTVEIKISLISLTIFIHVIFK